MDTKSRGGSTLRKGFTVYTNDPALPQIKLQVTGRVTAYLNVTPGSVRLFGSIDSPLRQTVEIVPTKGQKFKIKEIKADRDEYIRFKVKPLAKSSGKKGYQLHIENTKKEPGNYRDTILIKTDNKNKPLVRIPIYGRIKGPSKSSGKGKK